MMFVWWLVKRARSLKRKPDYRKARGCLEKLFEGDPRSSEQIVSDYREGDEYSEPQPRDYDILDYFDARLKWHDWDEGEGDSDGR